MIIDLHVHTSRGSGDSSLSPQELVSEARRIGLQGACLTEHGGPWDRFEFQRFAKEQDGLLLVPALEVETEVGHITVFGMNGYVGGIADPKELRRVADASGAYVVLAHPFRNMFHRISFSPNLLFKEPARYPATVEEALEHPVFGLVDAIEVANGGNTDEENAFAWEVAHRLGKPMVGGSDAHSAHGLGRCVTVFPKPLSTPEQFLQALRVGLFYPATGLNVGNLQPFRNGA
ncbi:MAG: CehA/McbA family metallohydrolase [Chloroflexota bacterium]